MPKIVWIAMAKRLNVNLLYKQHFIIVLMPFAHSFVTIDRWENHQTIDATTATNAEAVVVVGVCARYLWAATNWIVLDELIPE